MDEAVWAEVRRWIECPKEFAAVLQGSLPEEQRARLEAEARALDERLVALRRGRDAILELCRSGAVAPEEAEEALRKTKADLEAVRRRREEVLACLARHDLAREDVAAVENLRAALAEALDTLPAEARAQVVRLLVREAVLYPGRVILRAQIPAGAEKGAVVLPVGVRHI